MDEDACNVIIGNCWSWKPVLEAPIAMPCGRILTADGILDVMGETRGPPPATTISYLPQYTRTARSWSSPTTGTARPPSRWASIHPVALSTPGFTTPGFATRPPPYPTPRWAAPRRTPRWPAEENSREFNLATTTFSQSQTSWERVAAIMPRAKTAEWKASNVVVVEDGAEDLTSTLQTHHYHQ